MGLGVAASIAVEHITAEEYIAYNINKWIEQNPDVEVIDIKFSTSATEDCWATDLLIIFRKEN